jgi:hypothetical protein
MGESAIVDIGSVPAPSSDVRGALDRAFAVVSERQANQPDALRFNEDHQEPADKDGKKEASKTAREAVRRAFKEKERQDREKAKQRGEEPKDKPKAWSKDDAVEDRRLRSETISRAVEKHNETRRATSREMNDEEVRTARRELRDRFPGHSLASRLESFEKWEAAFKRDPVGTREAIMAEYLKMAPQNFSKSKERKYSQGIRGALEKGEENARDLADLKPYMDKYGKHFPHLLKQLNSIEADLVSDPVGTSARLAATYGAPATEAQQQQHEQQQAQQQYRERRVADMHKAFDLIVQHKIMPGIENAELQDKIADVLESKDFIRTGDPFQDLRTAYAVARMDAQIAEQGKDKPKPSKSISGPPGSNQQARKQAPAKSAREALERAVSR